MLTIHNFKSLEGRFLDFTGGWGVEFCIEKADTYAIHLKNPAYSPIINKKEFHLSRTLESLGNGEWRYFFYYQNQKIGFCVDADYIKDINVMVEFLSKIVNKHQ